VVPVDRRRDGGAEGDALRDRARRAEPHPRLPGLARLEPGLEMVGAADPVEAGRLAGGSLLQELVRPELLVRAGEVVARRHRDPPLASPRRSPAGAGRKRGSPRPPSNQGLSPLGGVRGPVVCAGGVTVRPQGWPVRTKESRIWRPIGRRRRAGGRKRSCRPCAEDVDRPARQRWPKWCASGSADPTSSCSDTRRASGPSVASRPTSRFRFRPTRSNRPHASRSGSPRTIAR
jgi:hypothetical protein